jgi:hypothetical protein
MANNLLDEVVDVVAPPTATGLSGELLKLRQQWERHDGGWDAFAAREVESRMTEKPDVSYWKDFLAGLDWTPETPGKLVKLYDLLHADGLITAEQCAQSKEIALTFTRYSQVTEGRLLSAWLREHRAYRDAQQKFKTEFFTPHATAQ